jgi:TonB-linked SusC/RagA family outer membrane protein
VILLFLIVSQILGVSSYATAQQIAVKGTVKDPKGESLIGVTVQVKGSNTAVATDIKGNFSLANVPVKASLVFSYIGMESKTVPLNSRTQIDVVLKERATTLDDVVVVGYQEIKRTNTSASIVSVQSKDIENTPAPTFESMLQGRMSGVNIQSLSGEPGVKNVFVIRGNTNISKNIEGELQSGGTGFSNPLYVVDGVPTTLEDLAGFDATNTNFLATLNTNDIESIDILKDASAAAIYGSRGANGVVIIKTKKGRIGEPVFTFNSFAGFSNTPDLVPVEVGVAERRAKYDLINTYWSQYAPGNPRTIRNDVPIMLSDSLNPMFNNNVNYQGIFYKPGIIQNYDFGVSGGTETTNYRVNLGYYDEDGIVTNTGFTRYSLSLNLGVKLSDRLENQTILRVGYVDRKTGLGNANSRWGTFPINPLSMNSSLLFLSDQEEQGLLGKYTQLRNKNLNLTTSISNTLRIKLTKGLFLNNTIGISLNSTKKDFFTPSTLNSNGKTYADYTQSGNKNVTLDTYLSYTKEIGEKHAFNALLGNSVNYNQNDVINTGGVGAASDQVRTVTGVDQTNNWGSSDFSENGMLSYWARLGYRLNERYILDLNFRADASSRFGKNSRWGNFPSISAGWIFSQESFLKEKLSWLDYGKLRGSWGINGSQFSNDYLRFNAYTSGNASYGASGTRPVTTYNGVTVANPNFSRLANDDLSWEQSEQWSVGMDLEFLGRRIYLTPEIYNRETKNLLFDVDFPIESGYSNSQANIAGVRNYGWELGITGYANKKGKDFQWQIDFNVANNHNQVTRLPNGNRDWKKYTRSLTVGLPMNLYYMMQNTGRVFSTIDDIPVNPYTGGLLNIVNNGATRVGTYEWVDVNGDHSIVMNVDLPATDARITPNKDPNPKFTGGIMNTITYKKWSLRIQSSYVLGRTIMNSTMITSLSSLTSNSFGWATKSMKVLSGMNYWRKPGDVADYATMYPAGNYVMYYRPIQSRWLEDGSYFKINNVTLSYSFDPIVLKKISLKYLRVYVMLDNVAMFQKFTGPDAERVDVTGADLGSGYALPSKATFGVNVRF